MDLLHEFHYEKVGIVLEGLHFSAYSLLGHMHHRLKIFLQFINFPDSDMDLWPEPYWPQQFQPENVEEWNKAMNDFERDLEQIISIIEDPATPLFKILPKGKTEIYCLSCSYIVDL